MAGGWGAGGGRRGWWPGGGGRPSRGAGVEEEDEQEDRPAPAPAWWMLSGYERSQEASVMVEALARVVAGGEPRREGVAVAPAAGGWQGYGEMAPPPHGNH